MASGQFLVTGSAGLIGAALQRALRQAGHDVRELDCRFHVSRSQYGELAAIANMAGGDRLRIYEAPQRSFDVARFVGDAFRTMRPPADDRRPAGGM